VEPEVNVGIVGEETLCRGKRFSLKRVLVSYGGRVFDRDVLDHPGSVAILPLHADGRVVLLRQWRPGCRCWLLEVPAGTLEPGEEPDHAARRELEEETGYTPEELVKLGVVYPTPGTSTEAMHLYVARGLRRGTPHPEEDEVIRVVEMPFENLYEMVLRGEVIDAKTALLALLARTRGLA